MRTHRLAPLALATALAGCGGGSADEAGMALEVPFVMPLTSCPQHAAMGPNMQASLQTVGGFDASPCPLAVDSTTLAVSGKCDRITVGIVQAPGPELLAAEPEHQRARSARLHHRWVDLRSGALSDTATEVSVNMTPDVPVTSTSTAELLTANADVLALRDSTTCATITDDGPLPLCKAEAWAQDHFKTDPINFEIDTSAGAEPNIDEACNGTPFPRAALRRPIMTEKKLESFKIGDTQKPGVGPAEESH